jgi:hypothetical protein
VRRINLTKASRDHYVSKSNSPEVTLIASRILDFVSRASKNLGIMGRSVNPSSQEVEARGS